MEVGGGSGPVPEEGDAHARVAAECPVVGSAHRVGELGGDGDGVEADAEAAGIPVGIAVAPVQLQERIEGQSPPEHCRMLAVGGEDPVFGGEGHRRPYRDRLLALHRGEGAHPSLALERHHAPVQGPPRHHLRMDARQQLGRVALGDLGKGDSSIGFENLVHRVGYGRDFTGLDGVMIRESPVSLRGIGGGPLL